MPFFVPSLDSLLRRAVDLFKSEFETSPEVGACAPGRVNLIGEHTDYNDGFVLPMALPLVTIFVGKANGKNEVRLYTSSVDVDNPHKINFPLGEALHPGKPKWANFVKGIISNFKSSKVPGFDAVIVSSVPVGGGLSSSAALEVAAYTFIEALVGKKTERLTEKALACQVAEHTFAGIPCGIMDQFISVMGQNGNALLIDCRQLPDQEYTWAGKQLKEIIRRSHESVLIPLDDHNVVILITNSNIKHNLGDSEYSKRKKQCEEAAKILGKKSLRDATETDLAKLVGFSDETLARRARHVITEIKRTKEAAAALHKYDFIRFGKLMTESHNSLRDDYEVSCKELDCIVNACLKTEGVYGSRMTGGGFGGCVVTLVRKEAVDNCIENVKKNYSGDPIFYICKPSAGAKQLTVIPN